MQKIEQGFGFYLFMVSYKPHR